MLIEDFGVLCICTVDSTSPFIVYVNLVRTKMNILLVIRIFFTCWKFIIKNLQIKKIITQGNYLNPKIYASQSTSIQRTTTLRNFTLGFTLCYQIYINIPSYHEKIYNWIEIGSLTSSIFTFLTLVLYLRPSSHPDILPLLFFMLFCTHMFTHTHKTRIFLWMRTHTCFLSETDCVTSLNIMHFKSFHISTKFVIYFSLEVNSLLFY